MIKGITITIYQKQKYGKDMFGHDLYEEIQKEVDDVLVAPIASNDISVNTNTDISKTQYNLAIPKGDDHDWNNTKVKFFGKTWKTVGEPIEGIEENIPLRWNKKVVVERYE
jgi:hypothetical protein